MTIDLDSTDETIDPGQSGQGGSNSRQLFPLEGNHIYLFVGIISLIIFLSAFLFYDNWLYEREHSNLTAVWKEYQDNQKDLDRLTISYGENTISLKTKLKKAQKIEDDAAINMTNVEEIKISRRHPKLISLRKELAKLTDDLYKHCNMEVMFVRKMRGRIDYQHILNVRDQNVAIYQDEGVVLKRFQHALPFSRSPLEGLRASNITAFFKGL